MPGRIFAQIQGSIAQGKSKGKAMADELWGKFKSASKAKPETQKVSNIKK
jgi:hypothetical protein